MEADDESIDAVMLPPDLGDGFTAEAFGPKEVGKPSLEATMVTGDNPQENTHPRLTARTCFVCSFSYA